MLLRNAMHNQRTAFALASAKPPVDIARSLLHDQMQNHMKIVELQSDWLSQSKNAELRKGSNVTRPSSSFFGGWDHKFFITKIFNHGIFSNFTKILNHENLELYSILLICNECDYFPKLHENSCDCMLIIIWGEPERVPNTWGTGSGFIYVCGVIISVRRELNFERVR